MKITGKEKTKEKESRSRRKADYLSVYDLFLRSGGCKVGIVIALTLLAEAITLVVLMQGETMYYENLFARGAALPFGIGFLLLTLALIDPLRAQKSNVDYTIRRLHIRPLDVFWVETVYVLLAYFVFWALNVTLLYACGAYFTSYISTAANREMGILLAFVRTPQLYMLLPIKNVTFWIRNITGVLALSACIARYSYFARKNQNKTILVFISVVLLVGSYAYVSGTEASGNLLVAALDGKLLHFGKGERQRGGKGAGGGTGSEQQERLEEKKRRKDGRGCRRSKSSGRGRRANRNSAVL